MRYLHKLSRDFNNHSYHYDKKALIQKTVRQKLWAMACNYYRDMLPIMDLGCGTGALSAITDAPLIGVDISQAMCEQTGRSYPAICADYHALPFANGVLRQVFSSLALQWSYDLEQCLQEMHAAMTKGGVFAFSTFVEGTLQELHKLLDGKPHMDFLPHEVIFETLKTAGFDVVEHVVEEERRNYPNAMALLQSMKQIGAGAKASEPGMGARKWLLPLLKRYDETYVEGDGVYASWHVGYYLGRKR